MERGKLYVVEGACDGIGKSTQFTLLNERLRQEGKVTTNHHFPSYDTYHGKPVEMYLKGAYGETKELSPYFIHTLYAMDRAIAWRTLLEQKYKLGNIILLDRYTTSSIIYQTALFDDKGERRAFVDYVCDFEYNKLGIKEPDNVIFLHAPFDAVTELRNRRVGNAGVLNDIIERDTLYMRKVYETSMEVADYLNWDMIDCSNGNTMKPIEEIHEDVLRLIRK